MESDPDVFQGKRGRGVGYVEDRRTSVEYS
jgi:hypothetical protein